MILYKVKLSFQSVIGTAFGVTPFLQIVGFSVVVVFFALMRQAHAWDLDLPIPSMLTAVETNLRFPLPFLYLGITPILLSMFLSFFMSQPLPPFASFTFVSLTCYFVANGLVIVLILISQLVFYVAAVIHIFVKTRLVTLYTSIDSEIMFF